VTGGRQASAPVLTAVAPPIRLPAPIAVPDGLPPMSTCGGDTWLARRCLPSDAPLAWHAQRCASSPMPTASPSVPCGRPGRSNLDPYLARLEARLAGGCEDAMALWREVRAQGYAGGRQMVQRWVAERRSKPASSTAHKWVQGTPASALSTTSDAVTALPSPKQLAWLLVQSANVLTPLDAAAVARVEQDKEAPLEASLARRFTALVRGCGVGQAEHPVAPLADLDAWLAEARACGVDTVETFAAGLEQDGVAVRAALILPWSNGQAEGQINRLKLLKRQSYGRASLDLLRRRVLMAA
jgi:transposase